MDFLKWLCISPLLIGAIVYHGHLKPTYEAYYFKQRESVSLQADLINKQHKHRILSQQFFLMRLEKLKKRLAKLPKCLRGSTSSRATIQAILNRGVSEGLTFERFEPEANVKNRLYTASPLSVDVLGSYPQIVQFIHIILKDHSEVHLDDFEVATSIDSTRERLQMKLRLIICRNAEEKTNDY